MIDDAVSARVAPRNGGASVSMAAGVHEASRAISSRCVCQHRDQMQANAVSVRESSAAIAVGTRPRRCARFGAALGQVQVKWKVRRGAQGGKWCILCMRRHHKRAACAGRRHLLFERGRALLGQRGPREMQPLPCGCVLGACRMCDGRKLAHGTEGRSVIWGPLHAAMLRCDADLAFGMQREKRVMNAVSTRGNSTNNTSTTTRMHLPAHLLKICPLPVSYI